MDRRAVLVTSILDPYGTASADHKGTSTVDTPKFSRIADRKPEIFPESGLSDYDDLAVHDCLRALVWKAKRAHGPEDLCRIASPIDEVVEPVAPETVCCGFIILTFSG